MLYSIGFQDQSIALHGMMQNLKTSVHKSFWKKLLLDNGQEVPESGDDKVYSSVMICDIIYVVLDSSTSRRRNDFRCTQTMSYVSRTARLQVLYIPIL